MTNVLFLVYEFPPLNSGGSHRPYRFVKYLHQFGINPTVVTPEVETNNRDDSLLSELDHDIKIIRTPIDKSIKFEKLLSKSYFNIMDSASKKWSKYLYPVLKELVEEIDFQAMYVTAPPFSIADLGIEVSKRFNIPLILDMRDHWSHWNITPFTSYLHYRLILRKENQWFKQASAVLAVSEQMIEDFENIHPNIDKNKFHTVRNSYSKEIVNINDEILVRKPTKENPPDVETFSLVCTEALFCETPVIASNVPPIPTFVNKSNGMLIENKSEIWNKTLIDFILSSDKFVNKNIGEDARKRFSPNAISINMQNTFKSIIKKWNENDN